MNPNPESELRRKLEMTEVPPPPHGLADRIKGGIPEELFPAKGGSRPLRARFFPLQVAASLFLLAGAAYMATRVLVTNDPGPVRSASYEAKERAPVVATPNDATMTAPTVPALAEIQTGEPAVQSRVETSSRPASPPPVVIADASEARSSIDRRRDTGDAAESMTSRESARGFEESREQIADAAEPQLAVSAVAAPSAPPPPAAAPAPARVPRRVAVADAAAESAAKSNMVTQGRETQSAPRLETAAPSSARAEMDIGEPSVFGISIDESSVARVRATLDRGEQPAAASVNAAAFVNYFAGSHTQQTGNVSLEVEGSAPPAATSSRKVLLRFSVDTARANLTGRPAARDAKIDVELNPRVVARHRRIGGDSRLSAAEPLLLRDISVTAMFELELLPLTTAPQHAVTVKLRYRDPDSGRQKTLSRVLHVRDFSRGWEQASRRHRRATLGGLLSEALKGTPTGIDLARRAQELAKEAPRDARAQELANAASASSRLRSSSPTGSGR